MDHVKLNLRVYLYRLSIVLSVLFLSSCNSGSTSPSIQSSASNPGILSTLAVSSPLYTAKEISPMIPLKLHSNYANLFVAIGGSAINNPLIIESGLNPDGTLDVLVDTGSPALIIPKYFLNPKNIKVLESCVVDYWGNVDDLVQGQVAIKSVGGGTKYSVDSFIFYAVRTVGDRCAKTTGGTPNNSYPDQAYFHPNTWVGQGQAMIGLGTGLLNPTYNSKSYCVGGFFNFLDYSKYSRASFSIISFGNGVPRDESQIPFNMQSYISIGTEDKGSNFNYSPMPNVSSGSACLGKKAQATHPDYWDGAPMSVTIGNLPIKLTPNPRITGFESFAYASVDTGGGSLSIADLPGNPNINGLKEINAVNSIGNGCYLVKPDTTIMVELHDDIESNNGKTLYTYKVSPAESLWGSDHVVICEYANGSGHTNVGFPLFYAANTVSFDFTNQRLGVSFGPITPPDEFKRPNYFCGDWKSMYMDPITSPGFMPWIIWYESAPITITNFIWPAYDCNNRLLHPELFLFH